MSVNAPKAGTITEILAKEEDTVTVGQDLFKLEPGEGSGKLCRPYMKLTNCFRIFAGAAPPKESAPKEESKPKESEKESSPPPPPPKAESTPPPAPKEQPKPKAQPSKPEPKESTPPPPKAAPGTRNETRVNHNIRMESCN